MTSTEIRTVRPNLTQAAVMGVATFAWYSSPDWVASRNGRAAVKVGLVALGGAGWVAARSATPDQDHSETAAALAEVREALRTDPAATLGMGVVIAGLTVALAAAGEKAIFAFGERRRARGVRGAHTVPALVWGALGAASVLVPTAP